MRGFGLLIASCLGLTLGCNPVVERSVDTTTPFITPAERAKMPIEERDDPYTLMHTKKSTPRARH